MMAKGTALLKFDYFLNFFDNWQNWPNSTQLIFFAVVLSRMTKNVLKKGTFINFSGNCRAIFTSFSSNLLRLKSTTSLMLMCNIEKLNFGHFYTKIGSRLQRRIEIAMFGHTDFRFCMKVDLDFPQGSLQNKLF